jgi:two-component system phosphate regulon response regulator PhoB
MICGFLLCMDFMTVLRRATSPKWGRPGTKITIHETVIWPNYADRVVRKKYSMAAQILVVEDDPGIQELIEVNLVRAGHLVTCAASGELALGIARVTLPDLILLDWMLPGMSGVDLARQLRADVRTRDVSIIMLTARDEERDKITGLETGADDYITKPFSPRELLARIAAVLRRRVPHATEVAVEMGGLKLDPGTQRVTVDGLHLPLGPTEFRLLHFLMTHTNRVYSRVQLLDQVWGDKFSGEERTVDVHIRRLRAAMEECGHDTMIQTVRGSGYSFSYGDA